jgi:hypothetical protein
VTFLSVRICDFSIRERQPERVVLTNAGGHLQIAEPPAAVSAQ